MSDNSALSVLTLKRRDESTFTGRSIPFEPPVIFGGQLLAQALFAAANTLAAERPASHLNAHFLNYGDPHKELEFHVRTLKDGKNLSVRQVEVLQEGRLLMLATVAFAQASDGYDFHSAMPNRPRPDDLVGKGNIGFSLGTDEDAFPFRMVACPDAFENAVNTSSIWVRSLVDSADSPLWQQMLFAFISDATILQSALAPHALVFNTPGLVVATMNHTIWFHRALRLHDWMLIHSECPSTGAGRAVSLAHAYSSAGELQCTVAQEGVLKGATS
tara:strand:+ start:2708 stop:3526 length:819 start_codon:yes stop_codon:yes gene_type:complete